MRDAARNGARLVPSLMAIALLAALPACSNRVISDAPWFHAEAGTARPALRDGVWRSEQPHCRVREATPAERWPTCASWAYLRGNQSLSPQWNEEGTGRRRRRSYDAWSTRESLVVAGDPLISQHADCDLSRSTVATDVADDGALRRALPSTPPDPPAAEAVSHLTFCYDAMHATASDAEGHITALETWPVLCGPWPSKGGNVTDQPWPGVALVGDNCHAASEAVLRDAAQRSRDVAVKLGFVARMHWVRDGYH